jgi:hypothetical protein
MLSSIRNGMVLLLLAVGAYGAFAVFQQSRLAAVIVGVLTLCIVIPILREGRSRTRARNRAEIGEDPSSKLGVGVRQARAMALREEGEILGAPAPRPR